MADGSFPKLPYRKPIRGRAVTRRAGAKRRRPQALTSPGAAPLPCHARAGGVPQVEATRTAGSAASATVAPASADDPNHEADVLRRWRGAGADLSRARTLRGTWSAPRISAPRVRRRRSAPSPPPHAGTGRTPRGSGSARGPSGRSSAAAETRAGRPEPAQTERSSRGG
jgi:hypothetical protein